MPIITLLTDYGTSDSYVAEVKGVLLTLVPDATLVDITHEILPGDVAAAGYILARAWSRFPSGTVHLAVVDPGVGSTRAALALRTRGHSFVGPDNGIFGGVLRGAEVQAVRLATPANASATFHGRDLFAPAAAALARGEPIEHLGELYTAIPRRLSGAAPRYEGKVVIGEVIHVDRYGNLVTNLTPEYVPPYAILEAESLVIGPLRSTFSDVEKGNLLAYLGSGGSVEIAVRDGSASRRLGLGVGGRVKARLG
jgi:S-adenosylmethionine hydrolase